MFVKYYYMKLASPHYVNKVLQSVTVELGIENIFENCEISFQLIEQAIKTRQTEFE